MKIVFFVDGFRSGGKERRCIELLKALKNDHRFDIHIVSLREEIVYPEFHTLDYPYHLIKKRKGDLSIFVKFYKLCKEINPDIVHCWSSMNATYAIHAKKKLKFKLINSQITDAPQHINWISIFGLQTKLNFRNSDKILANSKAGLLSYNAPIGKSECIYNGFDMNRVKNLETKEITRESYGIKTKYLVTMVGAFSDRKDYDSYIAVAKEICDKRNDITFMGIGEGKDLEKYRDDSRTYDNIKLPGRRENIESLVNASDLCVLMTNGQMHGEGISNSILEYMVIGKPVIASDSGGTSEIIENNETGFVIRNEDTNDLREKILFLINDPEKRIKMGILGKKRICEYFNLDKMSQSFIDLYIRVVN